MLKSSAEVQDVTNFITAVLNEAIKAKDTETVADCLHELRVLYSEPQDTASKMQRAAQQYDNPTFTMYLYKNREEYQETQQ